MIVAQRLWHFVTPIYTKLLLRVNAVRVEAGKKRPVNGLKTKQCEQGNVM